MERTRQQVGTYLRHYRLQISQIIKKIKLAASSCELCDGQCEHFSRLCQHCFNDLPIFSLDIVQGNLLNWPAINKALPKYQFDKLFCLAPYLWPFDLWITQLKYHSRFELAPLLAQLLVEHWLLALEKKLVRQVDAIIAVPIHITRWQERGFNQSHLLAKKIAMSLELPYLSTALIRNKATEQQVGKTGGQRRKSLKNAFKLSPNQASLPKHIMLIDDVITTGSTANEITQLLKKNGVQTVTLMTVCLTLP